MGFLSSLDGSSTVINFQSTKTIKNKWIANAPIAIRTITFSVIDRTSLGTESVRQNSHDKLQLGTVDATTWRAVT